MAYSNYGAWVFRNGENKDEATILVERIKEIVNKLKLEGVK
jgi:hypothetical protein